VYWDFGDINGGGRLSYLPSQSLVGSWQHFAMVASQSGNTMRIYRNGVLEASKTGMDPRAANNVPLRIGSFHTATNFFGGLIEEVRIWNVARTQAVIQSTMNTELNGDESGLLAYWRLDDGTGMLAADSAGNSDGSLVNGPAWTALYSDDDQDGIPDECESTCAPGATILGAVSRKACDLALSPVMHTEPRQGGVTELRLTFDVGPCGAGPSPVTIEQATCAAPTYVPYSGASSVSAAVVGNELVLNFIPGLENARTYRITIGPEVTSIAGQSLEVRGLIGDVNGNGSVNAIDRSVAVGVWTGAGFTCSTDVNNNQVTGGFDFIKELLQTSSHGTKRRSGVRASNDYKRTLLTSIWNTVIQISKLAFYCCERHVWWNVADR
jgi:hypothetical protein